MRALILVGGLGTRLRPLTEFIPKPLVPIAGEALMTRTLRRLKRQGVSEVILAVQYLADQFRAVYGDGTGLDLDLKIVEEPAPLGTAGAVRYALESAGQLPAGPTIVLNGDELSSLDVAALLTAHQAHGGIATIAVREVADPSAFGVVAFDTMGRVFAFQEKPAPGTALAATINSGTYVLEPAAIAAIKPGAFSMLERDLFPVLLGQNQPLRAVRQEAYSQDIGTLAGYLAANMAVLMGHVPHEHPTGQQHAPGIWVGPDVRIDPSATLVAPLMLGAGSEVGPGAYLERTVVWERVTIGADATIREAVLANDTPIAPGAIITGIAAGRSRP